MDQKNGTKQLTIAIDVHSMEKNMELNSLVPYLTVFMFKRRNKLLLWNSLRVINDDRIFSFGWIVSLKWTWRVTYQNEHRKEIWFRWRNHYILKKLLLSFGIECMNHVRPETCKIINISIFVVTDLVYCMSTAAHSLKLPSWTQGLHYFILD